MQSVLTTLVKAQAEESDVLHLPLVIVGVLQNATNEHFVEADGVHPITTSL